MPELRKYDIRTMEDLVAAARESGDLDTLMSDLRSWVEIALGASADAEFSKLFKVKPVFRWVDDGQTGISAINIDTSGGAI